VFNDSVENSIILAEWFDACIDAHKKLGFQPEGVRMAAHDPSDVGNDSKGYVLRHGSVVLDIQEKADGNVNEGAHWATGLAINANVDAYTWDCDGMGVALNEHTSKAFEGKHAIITMFKGSESPDLPDAVCAAADKASVLQQKTNKETFRNKRAQYYFNLRDRVYRTYLAVERGEYQDPDKLISFSSEIKLLSKLRAELCRIPIKPNGNGKFELYTKEEMKSKFNIKSPNLADSLMMAFRFINTSSQAQVRMPSPIRPMRLR
jgi:phage terminase large subunit